MLTRVTFLLVVLICSLQAVLIPRAGIAWYDQQADWPEYFQGARLQEQQLSPTEQVWAQNFPGAVKTFRAGNSQLVLRFVRRATRSLHSSRDCLKAAGFSVASLPLRVDHDGARWGCFSAVRDNENLTSCERVVDSNGESFSDVSAWYWNALLGRSSGPWWAVTIIE